MDAYEAIAVYSAVRRGSAPSLRHPEVPLEMALASEGRHGEGQGGVGGEFYSPLHLCY